MSSSTSRRSPLGRVGRPHGLKGEVTLVASTDAQIAPGASFLTDGDPPLRLVVATTRRHHGAFLVRFEGIEDRDHAEDLRGLTLTAPAAEPPALGDAEFWPDDLRGLVVVGPAGDRLGVVTGVVLGDFQDRLVVTTVAGTVVEVPFVDELVGEVHPSGGFVVVNPPDGLF